MTKSAKDAESSEWGAASEPLSERFLRQLGMELRTSLNGVSGFADLALRDTRDPLPEHHRWRMERIVEASARILRICDNAVELARIDGKDFTLTPERLVPRSLVVELNRAIEPSATQAGVTLEWDSFVNAPIVYTDRASLSRILYALCSNAVRHGRSGGTVRLGYASHGSYLRFSVADEGPGIAESKRKRLFLPFSSMATAGQVADGAGFGLAIAKRLAERIDGRIGYRDLASGGSEFWVEVPIAARDAGSGTRPATRGGADR